MEDARSLSRSRARNAARLLDVPALRSYLDWTRFQRPAGLALRAIVTIILVLDAAACLSGSDFVAGDLEVVALSPSLMVPLGLIILVCALIYALPATAFMGAILVTGLLGGAILTHLRLLEFGSAAEIACVLLGVFTWAGLWLNDARVRELMPLRIQKR